MKGLISTIRTIIRIRKLAFSTFAHHLKACAYIQHMENKQLDMNKKSRGTQKQLKEMLQTNPKRP